MITEEELRKFRDRCEQGEELDNTTFGRLLDDLERMRRANIALRKERDQMANLIVKAGKS